eukprot:Gregarina_sp_Pseudo_9__4226@NODE_437_length_2833_cov_19_972799_g413_i0_p2_GENE_NODE_437_length_2833_cov_19_972799_g413_i0NODE_437_length_2833_cov_19_972799_g413_i0_p2_ORF_typecomplete_len304_score28_65EMC3_TMCO1/PF01956_16/1_5e03EMC3_TMCO1/PF01956_16/1_5e21_NODE_437_length_2833_cov_19_972799_g413_i019222719
MTHLATLLRQCLSELMQKSGGGANPMMPGSGGPSTLSELHTTNVVAVSKLTRAAASSFIPSSLLGRKRYYLGADEDGILCNPPAAGANPLQNMMTKGDPSAMAGMMKYNVGFLILNGGLAYLISFLFSDSVVAKTPFPLTPTFKPLLQRGIEVNDLDTAYVSAISWYFLILFCSGSYSFLLNRALGSVRDSYNVLADLDPMMAMTMGGAGASPFAAAQPEKLFGEEADNWKLQAHTAFLPDIEVQALKALTETQVFVKPVAKKLE